jgi:hypothetical protein
MVPDSCNFIETSSSLLSIWPILSRTALSLVSQEHSEHAPLSPCTDDTNRDRCWLTVDPV